MRERRRSQRSSPTRPLRSLSELRPTIFDPYTNHRKHPMTTSFLTDMLARHAAEIEAAVADLKANVCAQIDGVARVRSVTSIAKPARKATEPGSGKKRSPADLEALTKALGAYIAKHPGQRIEQIGEGMSYATKALILPVKKLIADGSIKTKGVKRATSYFSKG